MSEPAGARSADAHHLSDAAYANRLALGFAALVALTFGLIVLGALVRANGAGLACPDWPLCFGELVPRFDVKIAFEWSHRAIAGSVSILFAGLAYALLRRPATRAAARGWIALGAVVLAVQIVLGALTVWELLASWTVTSHLLTGNAFNAVLLLTAMRLREIGRDEAIEGVAAIVPRLAVASLLLLTLQLALGGFVSSSFAGLACPDWPSCSDGVWFPSFEGARGLHLLHRLGAYALVATLVVLAFVTRAATTLAPLALAGAGVGLLQTGVGIANVLLRIPVELTGLHSALAAALVLLSAAFARESLRAARAR
jgi:cytochrome c oxidase assembly protein subunit 15